MRFTPACFVSVLGMILAMQGHAVAPVVDDSENFTVFDDQGHASAPASSSQAISHASTHDEEPLAKAIPEDKSQNMSMQAQVRALQQEVQSLRGELEVQAHTLEQLKQQQMTLYKDLDTRLHAPVATKNNAAQAMDVPASAAPKSKADMLTTSTSASTKPVAASVPVRSHETTASEPPSTSNKNPADEQIAYLAAYDLVKAKRYADALTAMQAFIKQYPHGGYTANAEYWTGELFLAKNLPAQAMQHFENVLNQFPTSSKAAASALKIGYALSAMGHREDAKQRFKEVIKNYPDTAAAQLAKSKLEGL